MPCKRPQPTYHCLHHVWLRVSQRFGSKEHVCYAVVTNHFQDHGAGTESTASTTTIPAPERTNQDTHASTDAHPPQKHIDMSDLIKMCSQAASRRGELQSEMSQFD